MKRKSYLVILILMLFLVVALGCNRNSGGQVSKDVNEGGADDQKAFTISDFCDKVADIGDIKI